MKHEPVTSIHAQPTLVAAGLILRRRTGAGDRWLLLRSAKHREWGFPKGHQDAGESPLRTALRECVEECGIALLAIDGDPLELNYLVPGGRAKKVVYFPAITACDSVALSDEHDAWRWAGANEVRERLGHPNLVRLFESHLRIRER
jgi:8-oxo-dGTP pyrophosphatase MutT (NUDIX family)